MLDLLLRFHAFRDDAHAEPLCHGDDGIQYDGTTLWITRLAQEPHIDFQNVRLDVLEHGKRGVAAAEVIDLDLEARLLQAADELSVLFDVTHQGRLRDLQLQLLCVNAVALHDVRHRLENVEMKHVVHGNVDGDRQPFLFRSLPTFQNRRRLFPDVLVKTMDQSRILQNADELSGREEAFLGMIPAHERLRAEQIALRRNLGCR